MVSDGFVTLGEAARRTGLSPFSVRRRVQNGTLAAYRHPLDRRRYLVKESDLDRLLRVEPVTPRRAREGDSAA